MKTIPGNIKSPIAVLAAVLLVTTLAQAQVTFTDVGGGPGAFLTTPGTNDAYFLDKASPNYTFPATSTYGRTYFGPDYGGSATVNTTTNTTYSFTFTIPASGAWDMVITYNKNSVANGTFTVNGIQISQL